MHHRRSWIQERGVLFLREALFTYGTLTAELRKSVRSGRLLTTNHNHFLRMANGDADSPLVKYVIFEKFRSDPEKDGSEVALAVDTSIHRDPVLDAYFRLF